VPLPSGQSDQLAWLFAAERMDTWVLKFSIAIPLVCIAGLGLWHLMVYLAGKLPKRPRTVRSSPEPPSIPSREFPPRGRASTKVASPRVSPEQLQQACIDLEDSLAGAYMELAESWLRTGQLQKAAAALKKIVQICPERRQAQLAQDRLRQIGNDVEDHHS
jgi:hypothetical protein